MKLARTLSVVSAFALAAFAPAEEIKWTKAFAAAIKEAKKTKKLVLVDFYADWCTYCKLMDRTTMRDKKVVSAVRAGFVPVRLNTEVEGRIQARLYRVDQLPALIIFDGEGSALLRFNGMPSAKQMLSFMEEGRQMAQKKKPSGPTRP